MLYVFLAVFDPLLLGHNTTACGGDCLPVGTKAAALRRVGNLLSCRVLLVADVDECERPELRPNCHLQAQCVDTIGSVECRCTDGLIGDGIRSCVGRGHNVCFV